MTRVHTEKNRETISLIAGRKPAQVEREAGAAYFWCRCSRSRNQPFCGGAGGMASLTGIRYAGLGGSHESAADEP